MGEDRFLKKDSKRKVFAWVKFFVRIVRHT
jgi:hypothetical protein